MVELKAEGENNSTPSLTYKTFFGNLRHYQDQLFYKALKKQERILSSTFSLDPAPVRDCHSFSKHP